MADQFFDGCPTISQPVSTNVDRLEQSLGFLKDILQEVVRDWNDSVATGIEVDKINDEYIIGATERKLQVAVLSADNSETFTGLETGVLYRVHYKISFSGTSYFRANYNSDFNNNYQYNLVYDTPAANWVASGNISLGYSPWSSTANGWFLGETLLFGPSTGGAAAIHRVISMTAAGVCHSSHLLQTGWEKVEALNQVYFRMGNNAGMTGKIVVERMFA